MLCILHISDDNMFNMMGECGARPFVRRGGGFVVVYLRRVVIDFSLDFVYINVHKCT